MSSQACGGRRRGRARLPERASKGGFPTHLGRHLCREVLRTPSTLPLARSTGCNRDRLFVPLSLSLQHGHSPLQSKAASGSCALVGHSTCRSKSRARAYSVRRLPRGAGPLHTQPVGWLIIKPQFQRSQAWRAPALLGCVRSQRDTDASELGVRITWHSGNRRL